MPALMDLPTQEFASRAAMLADQFVNEWSKKRYVIILSDEEFQGGLSFHLFTMVYNPISGLTEGKLILLFAENGGAQIVGLPPGGVAGQMLIKNSDEDYDVRWADVPVFNESFALLLAANIRLTIKPGVNLKIH